MLIHIESLGFHSSNQLLASFHIHQFFAVKVVLIIVMSFFIANIIGNHFKVNVP